MSLEEVEQQSIEQPAEPPVISVKEWMITLLIMSVPIVGLVFLFIWGFGKGHHPSKTNYAKSRLLLLLILTPFYIAYFVFVIFYMDDFINQSMNQY